MKQRKGFVSNSSSSSFIIIGVLVAKGRDILDVDVSQYDNLLAVGGSLSDGSDVFPFTVFHQELLKNTSDEKLNLISLYNEIFLHGHENDSKITLVKDDLKDDRLYSIVYGEEDFHSSRDHRDLLNNVAQY